MTHWTGGELLVRALDKLGVEQMFSVSGGPINAIYDACATGPVLLRHVRSEGAAGFMAEASYRRSGQAGVAVVTLGPAVTNTVTPCVSAKLAGVPMLVVGGQAGLAVVDKGAGMSTDTVSTMSTVTKWAVRVFEAERIPEYVGEAWRRMHAPTPGPVYLEIAADVLDTVVPEAIASRLLDALDAEPVEGSSPSPDALAEVRAALDGVSRCLVLVGDDCFHTADRAGVERFIDSVGGVYASLRLARGLLPDTGDRSLGPGYLPCNPVLARAMREAETVVLLGHHWEFDLDFGAGVGEHTTVVQVDPDAARLRRNGPVHVAVNCSAGGFVEAWSRGETGSGKHPSPWVRELVGAWREHREHTSQAARSSVAGLHPVTLVEAVAAGAPDGAAWVTSHGNVDFWADEALSVEGGVGTYLRAGQSGTLGAEIPYGVSAALVDTDSPAIVFVGDGAVGYAIAELDSAARYGANVLVVVADDEQWTAIALPQARRFGKATELGLPERDWVAIARGLGARAERAETADEVTATVAKLLSSPGPALLHVPIAAVESPYMTYISK